MLFLTDGLVSITGSVDLTCMLSLIVASITFAQQSDCQSDLSVKRKLERLHCDFLSVVER